MTALLDVRGLRCGYEGIPVVFGIDLEVGAGEVVALLGANGAGKTTTLRAISGMLRPMAGSISFDGDDITGHDAAQIARAGLVHVPEGRGIFPTLDVEEMLVLAARLSGAGRTGVRSRLDEVYDLFPRLAERRRQQAGTLSGGEQQMLALGRALVAHPRLLMIDEMSQGLAPTVVDDLFRIIADFPSRGLSLLLVEQFVGQALQVATRAYVLEKGEVSYGGPAAELAADEAFVRSSYLGEQVADGARPRVTVGAGNGSRAGAVMGEEVKVRMPASLLRGLEERAAREGVEVDALLQELVDDAAVRSRRGSGRRPLRARSPRGKG
jgi:branched-chain amino acid transport system ATP-binding protein